MKRKVLERGSTMKFPERDIEVGTREILGQWIRVIRKS